MKIYLYVKTHNETGLKYFGKTTSNPYSYRGSGKNWVSHLKQFGNDVSTEVVGEFEDRDECASYARQFSQMYDIANSEKWANLIPETLGGWNTNPQAIKNSLLSRYGKDYFQRIASFPTSEATKSKLSKHPGCAAGGKKNLGRIREKLVCPHCGKVGAKNVMLRWHFEKCQSR